MQHYTLRTYHTKETLFEGQFHSLTECLETAISQKKNLSHIDLRFQNLSNANLDEAIMPDADFTGANLNGTNLTESYLHNAIFYNTTLYSVCLCYSNLSNCNFISASFGATDILGAIMTQTLFSTLSAFTLNFSTVKNMQGSLFVNPDGSTSSMSRPPIVINGYNKSPIIILDQEIRHGHNIIDHKRLYPLSQKLAQRTLRSRLRQQVQNIT